MESQAATSIHICKKCGFEVPYGSVKFHGLDLWIEHANTCKFYICQYCRQKYRSNAGRKGHYSRCHRNYEMSLSESLAASLFQQNAVPHTTGTHTIPHPGNLQYVGNQEKQQKLHKMEIKHSLSENDEETIDAFDPTVTGVSPLSDTASENTLQNFIPDVPKAELSRPDHVSLVAQAAQSSGVGSGSGIGNNNSEPIHDHNEIPAEAKRIEIMSLSESLAASLFQQNAVPHTTGTHTIPHPGNLQYVGNQEKQQKLHKMEIKHSLSENDEETIDAFDPTVTGVSPLSDTASENTLQNFIPDVQKAELSRPDPVSLVTQAAQSSGVGSGSGIGNNNSGPIHDHNEFPAEAKRIKTEVTTSCHLFSEENTDMEFFRSILPDIAALTPQQKRKFKIGVLELIDDVVERNPQQPTEQNILRHRQNSVRD